MMPPELLHAKAFDPGFFIPELAEREGDEGGQGSGMGRGRVMGGGGVQLVF